jgi:hypothetical protein
MIKIFILPLMMVTNIVIAGSNNDVREIKANKERFINIEGVATKILPANLLKVELSFWHQEDSTEKANKKIKEGQDAIKDLLVSVGFEKEKIDVKAYSTNDVTMSGGKKLPKPHYKINGKIIAETSNVDLGAGLSEKMLKLNELGIKYKMKIDYILSDVESLRPELSKEALKNAQNLACDFAASSHMEVKKVRSAHHSGYLTILSPSSTQGQNGYQNKNDHSESKMKKVKFSLHVEYDLE